MHQRPCARGGTITLLLCTAWTMLLVSGCKLRGAEAEQNSHFKDGGYSAVLDELGIPHKTLGSDMKQIDPSQGPKGGAVNGPAPIRVTGERAGLPLATMPGIRRLSLDEVKRMDVIKQGTGLFVVDIDFLPRELPEILRSKGLTLHPTGELVGRDGQSAVAFITSEVYQTRMPDRQEPRQSWMPDLLQGLADGLVPSAEAASPFPLRCMSLSAVAIYHGGFYRWYEANTWTSAFGPDAKGKCSGSKPFTMSDFLQADAKVQAPGSSQPGSSQHCFKCAIEFAYDEWDVGAFWPAHGIPLTTHSGIWADGKFVFSDTIEMSW